LEHVSLPTCRPTRWWRRCRRGWSLECIGYEGAIHSKGHRARAFVSRGVPVTNAEINRLRDAEGA
jgi:hypothetical protein